MVAFLLLSAWLSAPCRCGRWQGRRHSIIKAAGEPVGATVGVVVSMTVGGTIGVAVGVTARMAVGAVLAMKSIRHAHRQT